MAPDDSGDAVHTGGQPGTGSQNRVKRNHKDGQPGMGGEGSVVTWAAQHGVPQPGGWGVSHDKAEA